MGTAGIIGLVLVAILALGVAGYTGMNPHIATVTQQQIITNTQNVFNTQTQTVTSVNQVTQSVTAINTQVTATGQGQPPSAYQYCSSYGCMYAPGPASNTYNPYNPPTPWTPGYYNGVYYGYDYYGNFVPPCGTGPSGNVTCRGYFFQAQNGCDVLVIPMANAYYDESIVYQYYSLHNLPSTPSNGQWVTVSGQLFQGANNSPSGASCPGNYINVSSIQ